jgi:hypothetical protein
MAAASKERLIEKTTSDEACHSHLRVLPDVASFLSTWIPPDSMETSAAAGGAMLTARNRKTASMAIGSDDRE